MSDLKARLEDLAKHCDEGSRIFRAGGSVHMAEQQEQWAALVREAIAALLVGAEPHQEENEDKVARVEPGATTPAAGSTAQIANGLSEVLPAQRYFDVAMAEWDLDEALMRAFGAGIDDPETWPAGSSVYDSYDASFELRGTRNDFVPTDEHIKAALALGFDRGWICYEDGTEVYVYEHGKRGERRASRHGGNRDEKRAEHILVKRLRAELLTAQAVGEEPAADSQKELLADLRELELIYNTDEFQQTTARNIERIFDKWLHESRSPDGDGLGMTRPNTAVESGHSAAHSHTVGSAESSGQTPAAKAERKSPKAGAGSNPADSHHSHVQEPAADPWHPIATAPKDETVVLLWDGVQPRTGYWMHRGQWSSVCRPTHWMPLPAPPGAASPPQLEKDQDDPSRVAPGATSPSTGSTAQTANGSSEVLPVEQGRRLDQAVLVEAIEALEFYADPETYFAILFLPDRPAGAFMEDFSDTPELGAKPGAKARAALNRLEQLQADLEAASSPRVHQETKEER